MVVIMKNISMMDMSLSFYITKLIMSKSRRGNYIREEGEPPRR